MKKFIATMITVMMLVSPAMAHDHRGGGGGGWVAPFVIGAVVGGVMVEAARPAPTYYAPPPVYYAPQPQVIYVQPQPVYEQRVYTICNPYGYCRQEVQMVRIQ